MTEQTQRTFHGKTDYKADIQRDAENFCEYTDELEVKKEAVENR